jgi:hypothetical protein
MSENKIQSSDSSKANQELSIERLGEVTGGCDKTGTLTEMKCEQPLTPAQKRVEAFIKD